MSLSMPNTLKFQNRHHLLEKVEMWLLHDLTRMQECEDMKTQIQSRLHLVKFMYCTLTETRQQVAAQLNSAVKMSLVLSTISDSTAQHLLWWTPHFNLKIHTFNTPLPIKYWLFKQIEEMTFVVIILETICTCSQKQCVETILTKKRFPER